jgi:hypothetical protein
MFKFIIKTENVDGVVITREFDTASCFLAACESDDIDVAISFDDPIVSVSYGGIDVDISKFKIVDDLYYWMCSDACDWFK